MGIANSLQKGLDRITSLAGKQIIIRYYSGAVDSVYDDELTLAISGTVFYGSGIIMPLDLSRGSEDAILVEQGKLQDNDKKIFVSGNTLFTGSDHMAKVFLGSQTLLGSIAAYSVIERGTFAPEVEGIPVYKKAYIRLLPTGSFVGET